MRKSKSIQPKHASDRITTVTCLIDEEHHAEPPERDAVSDRPFPVGALVFREHERGDPDRIMQVRGYWKDAVVTRNIHPDRPLETRNDQRHAARALVSIESKGCAVTVLENGRHIVETPKGRPGGGRPVRFKDALPIV